MGGRPFPEVHCVICGQALDLRKDLSADENGKALRPDCYLKQIGVDTTILHPTKTS